MPTKNFCMQEVPDLVQHILGEVEANNEYLAESMGQVSVCEHVFFCLFVCLFVCLHLKLAKTR